MFKIKINMAHMINTYFASSNVKRIVFFVGIIFAVILTHTILKAIPSLAVINGGISATAQDEVGNALTGGTLNYLCTGGTTQTCLDNAACDADATVGVIDVNSPAGGASCDDIDTLTTNIEKDGYKTHGLSNDITYNTGSHNSAGTSANQFAYKISNVTSEVSQNIDLAGTTVKAGDAFGTTCILASSIWYCPVPLANTSLVIQVERDGFITNTATSFATDRTSNSQNQSSLAGVTNILYSLKVLGVSDELGNTITPISGSPFSVTGFTSSVPQYSSGVWYVAGTAAVGTIAVNVTGYQATAAVNVTPNSTSQQTLDFDSGSASYSGTIDGDGALFNLKVVVNDELGNALTGVTVTHNAVAPTATSLNSYYFATSTSNAAIAASKDGYVNLSSAVDSQITDVDTGSTQGQTVVTFSGISACTGTQVLAGATATCNGLDFAYKIADVTTEISATLDDVSTTVKAGNSVGTTCTLSSSQWYCAVPLADNTLTIQIERDGYVTNTGTSFASDRTAATDAQVSLASVTGVQYGYKITGLTAEATASAITPTTLTVGDSTAKNSCTLSSGSWYCPVVLANSDTAAQLAGVVTLDGYVQTTGYNLGTQTARSANTDSQKTSTIANVQYAYKLTGITSEVIATSLTPSAVTVGDSTGKNTCTLVSDSWYCPVILANSDTAAQLAGVVTLDGYVQTAAGYNLGTQTARTSNSDTQKTSTVSNVQYAHKITAQREVDNGSITGGNARIGNINCGESSGVYYCAIPLASDGGSNDVQVASPGYVTYSTNSNNRTANTDAQSTYTSANLFTLKVAVQERTTLAPFATYRVTVSNTNNTLITTTTADITSGDTKYFALDPLIYSPISVNVSTSGYVALNITNRPIGASMQRNFSFQLEPTPTIGGGNGSSEFSRSGTSARRAEKIKEMKKTEPAAIKSKTSGSGNKDGTTSGGSSTGNAVTTSTNAPIQTEVVTKSEVQTAHAFANIPKNHWAKSYLIDLYNLILSNSGEVFKFDNPDKPITRDKVIKYALIVFGYEIKEKLAVAPFKDTSLKDPSTKYYAAAKMAGIINGFPDGTLRKDAKVQRDEITKILTVASKLSLIDKTTKKMPFIDVSKNNWSYFYIYTFWFNSLVNGKTALIFAPGDYVTYGEMAKMVINLKDLVNSL